MSRCYDLHSHTIRSDGTLTPAGLVARACDQGVEVLAITDHDVTDGIAEARQAAGRCGLELVPGVEVSVTWEGRTLHVVGLQIDPDNAQLQEGLAGLRDFRDWRATEIARRLEKKRIAGAYEGARALVEGRILSRTHFARHLAEAGHVKDVAQAFKKYLGDGKPAYVPGKWAALAEAIRWIRAAGGQAVLAHPSRYKLGGSRLKRLLTEFKTLGGEAIEVVTTSHGPDEVRNFARLAGELGLLASCGSDFHGPDRPWVELGRLPALPAGCTPIWQGWEDSPFSTS